MSRHVCRTHLELRRAVAELASEEGEILPADDPNMASVGWVRGETHLLVPLQKIGVLSGFVGPGVRKPEIGAWMAARRDGLCHASCDDCVADSVLSS